MNINMFQVSLPIRFKGITDFTIFSSKGLKIRKGTIEMLARIKICGFDVRQSLLKDISIREVIRQR
ncbi:MAG: hypothetical protein H0Z30_04030 [Candidatus Marinimicrobia bacterium]|nr:hypothetical protein [Candidatus Neomarinimicrobiota bacterium]